MIVGVASCSLSGAGHYRTFDSLQYDYSGSCKYTMASPQEQHAGTPYFEVYVKTEHRYGIMDVSWPKYVEVSYDNDVVRMAISNSTTDFVPVDVFVSNATSE